MSRKREKEEKRKGGGNELPAGDVVNRFVEEIDLREGNSGMGLVEGGRDLEKGERAEGEELTRKGGSGGGVLGVCKDATVP